MTMQIWINLLEQRQSLLERLSECAHMTLGEYENHINSMIFGEHDHLENHLREQGLTIEEINPNSYRDYQQLTVELCIELFKMKFNKGDETQ